jgi:hypothetical protein
MLKRTKGRLLITLLVVTGLAGTLNSDSVSQQERKYAVTQLKDSKTSLLEEVKGLSAKQLSYRSPSSQLSIKNCLIQMAVTEKKLWETIANAMKQPANPEKRADIELTDEKLIELTQQGEIGTLSTNTFKQANSPIETAEEAATIFKSLRNDHIKYMKSSTEDLRNHVVLTPAGWLDCYQLILLMSASTNHCVQLIENIKTEAGFLKK